MIYVISIFFLISSFTQASLVDAHDYQIHADEYLGSEIDEERFDFIINTVYKLYLPDSKKQQRELQIGVHDWRVPYFSAWATHDEEHNHFKINFWGAFAGAVISNHFGYRY